MSIVIETRLRRAASRQTRLRLLQHTATLASAVTLLLLLLAVGIVRGWWLSRPAATLFCALLALTTVLVWVGLALSVALGQPARDRLAAMIERVHPTLLDRLNTLVFLERLRKDDPRRAFSRRVERQTQDVMLATPVPPPYPARRALVHLGVFAGLLAVTWWMYDRYDPWSRLRDEEPVEAMEKINAPPPDLSLPAANTAEQNRKWGEVRISDPGKDLRVTKVESVPLQIEAAADETLTNVSWSSTVNGDAEQTHALPAPAEPRFAAYQPIVYVDEFKLADWDVMTYYAKAATESDAKYASEVYFLEVRPFREDILKMPGGEGGGAYKCLSELSALIARQQHIIRETHHYTQQPPSTEDRDKLADAETDLADSSRHLYAKIAAELENQPIGNVLDHLAAAEKWLDGAAGRLRADALPEAQSRERTALTELIATRKQFQKFIAEHPDAFGDENSGEEKSPVADATGKLKQMEEFRNESKAAQDFVKQLREQQEHLGQAAASSKKTDQPKLAQQQEELARSLQDFSAKHEAAFRDATNELAAAQKAMRDAADALEKKTPNAKVNPALAAGKLQALEDALKDQSAGQQLADAYKLKQMLDAQQDELKKLAGDANALTPEQKQQLADAAKKTTDELKRSAEQAPTRQLFDNPLRRALSDEAKRVLDEKLSALARAHDEQSTKEMAGQAGAALDDIGKAFDESAPRGLRAARQNDALKEENPLERAMQQLQSLLGMDGGQGRPDEQKLRDEALANLQQGLSDKAEGQKLILMAQDVLRDDAKPIDTIALKKLMDEIKNFSVEIADAGQEKPEHAEMTHIDPSKLPPAYRGRIERYFKKLSEQ